jgi:hypothetical protein
MEKENEEQKQEYISDKIDIGEKLLLPKNLNAGENSACPLCLAKMEKLL